jgi:serine/threonine protein phosphatase PrpC
VSVETKLYFAEQMADVEERPIAGGSVVAFSMATPGRAALNQDAAALLPLNGDSGVLAVADGLGGERSGAQAAALAIRCLASAVRGWQEGGSLRTAILDGFEVANRSVRELGVGAATTLAVVEIADGAVRPYHVGDSSVLLFGRRGKLKLQTVSHSPVGFGVEAGLIDEADAMHHDERHLVSNVLGSPDMRIEIGPRRRLAARDTVLLASDGLLDNLHTEEIVERACSGPLADAARRLMTEALRRMTEPTLGDPSKPDDLTFLLFRLEEA